MNMGCTTYTIHPKNNHASSLKCIKERTEYILSTHIYKNNGSLYFVLSKYACLQRWLALPHRARTSKVVKLMESQWFNSEPHSFVFLFYDIEKVIIL